jgi:hypothetical protein
MGRSLVAGLCVLAAAGGGYAAGKSKGADLAKARREGQQAGTARASADRGVYTAAYRRGYRAALRGGRK